MLHHSPETTPNRFLTIEGGEGVGKSFLSNGIKARLEALGHSVILTREPGGTKLGDAVRELFLHPPEKPNPMAELFLVSAARAQHVENLIQPALDAKKWVLCDRFYDSTRVYQGDLGKVPPKSLETVIEQSVQGCHPSLTFVLDCPAAIARSRVTARAKELPTNEGNRYDEGSLAMYEVLRNAYLKRAKDFSNRIVIIDASQSPEQVLETAWSHLSERLREIL